MQKERRKTRKKSIMELKALKHDKNAMTFVMKGTNSTYVNTLRRMVLQKVPTMAIEDVTFVENGSALYDEFLALRLGLIPLTTDLESYTVRSKCKCEGNGCARCELTLTMDKKGPCTVYAEDMKTSDPKVKPAFPKMPITKLLEGQSLKFEAKAILGSGKEHMKFAPGTVFFKGYPQIKIDQPSKVAAEQCPVNILKRDGKTVKVTDATACILCKACEEASPDNAIAISESDKDFIITVESWGQLTPKEIVEKAIEALDEELDDLKESVKKLK